jgi:probable rRNA maturation factor
MAALNRRWRRKDHSTDVLSFPAGGGDRGFLGDIVISLPYATRQARRRGEAPAREIDRLLLHGYLHLLGYDHEADEGEMERLEARLRKRFGIAEA